MTFKEIKETGNFRYTVKTWYGDIAMTCKDQLDATILDTAFLTIIKNRNSKGSFRYKDTDKEIKICYTWIKSNHWDLNKNKNK